MCVVVDTCVLIDFLCIDRMDLIGDHPSRFISTDEVEQELLMFPVAARERIYQRAIQNRYLAQTQLRGLGEKKMFDDLEKRNKDLSEDKELGPGDCSVLAVAYHRMCQIATHDLGICEYAQNSPGYIHPILSTRMIINDLIQAGTLTDAAAGGIYRQWTRCGRHIPLLRQEL